MGHIKDRWYTGRGDTKKPSARHGTGLRWQIWYQVDGREKCGGSYAVKAVAQRKLVELESSVIRGQWVDPTDSTTVTELMWNYAGSRIHRPLTAERLERTIRNHVEATALGSRRIVSVRPSEAQAWVSDRAQVLAPTTLRVLVGQVRGAFNTAVLDNLIAANPFARVSMPRLEENRIVPLTVAQVSTLADAIGVRYRAMVVTQAGLGLRVSELLALRVQDVDFLRRTVRVEHQIDHKSRDLAAPKTGKSRRTLPLPNVVAEEIAQHIATRPPAPNGLIFHTDAGLPYLLHVYGGKVFPAAVAKAGLPKHITTHDLRHHYACVLLAAGESVIVVAERLGHTDARLVLTTYGHVLPDTEDRTRKAIDGAWNALPDVSGARFTAQGRPE